MKTSFLHRLLFVALTLGSAIAAAAKQPVIGFLMVEADRHFTEERDTYPYATRVLAKHDFGFGLGEWHAFFGNRASQSGALDMLRQFNVTVIDTPFDSSIMDLGPQRQRTAAAARGRWRSTWRKAAACSSSCRPCATRETRTRITPT